MKLESVVRELRIALDAMADGTVSPRLFAALAAIRAGGLENPPDPAALRRAELAIDALRRDLQASAQMRARQAVTMSAPEPEAIRQLAAHMAAAWPKKGNE